MRLYAPLYEADSYQRPDAAVGETIARIFNSPQSAASFVHGNIAHGAAMRSAPDLQEIEICARAARSAWTGTKLRSMYKAVADWLARHDKSERDDYFVSTTKSAELGLRQRDFERTELTRYLYTLG